MIRRFRKIMLWIGIPLFLVVIIGLGIFVLFGKSELSKITAELDANEPGWRYQDIVAAREAYNPEPNSYKTFDELIQKHSAILAGSPNDPDFDTLRLLPEQLPKELAEWIEKTLSSDESAVELARTLAKMPQGKFPIQYQPNWIETDLAPLQKARGVARLLAWDALRQTHRKRFDLAFVDLQATLNASRAVQGEHTLVANLIGIALDAIWIRGIQDVLSQGVVSEDLLRGLQNEIVEQSSRNLILPGLRGERAGFAALAGLPSNKNGGMSFYFRFIGSGDQAMGLRMMTEMISLMQLPPHQMIAKAADIDGRIKNLTPWQFVMTRLLTPAVVKIVEAYIRRQATLQSAAAAIAAERYRLAKGKWPAELKDLTPDFIEVLPADPYTGEPLKFAKFPDGIAVYSVGKDLKDDGGDLVRISLDEPRVWALDPAQRPNVSNYVPKDTGFRLWNPDRRAGKPAILKLGEQPKN